jgi:hypothetical protein
MHRRSFLSLLGASVAIPALAKLQPLVAEAPAFEPLGPGVMGMTPESINAAKPYGRVVQWLTNFAADEGFNETIEPGRIARFIALPQRCFRPRRLIVAGDSSGFELIHVAANGSPQLDAAVPADLFSPDTFGQQMHFETVSPGESVVLCVRNVGNEPAEFRAVMIGDAIDDAPLPEQTHEEMLAETAAWDRELDEDDDDEGDA